MGTELLLGVGLGFLILGPKRMHEMLGQLGRAKAQFDKASRGIKSQLAAEFGRESSSAGSSSSAGDESQPVND
jgi:Sec-independent protein translocase protein TatA